jgi:hypothetical protein
LIRNVFAGETPKSWSRSSDTARRSLVGLEVLPPCVHTRYIDETGRYSQRRTVFELNSLTFEAAGFGGHGGVAIGREAVGVLVRARVHDLAHVRIRALAHERVGVDLQGERRRRRVVERNVSPTVVWSRWANV